MAKQVPWNRAILEEFIRVGGLTPTEVEIMKMRVIKDYSRVKISLELNMSVSRVDQLIRVIKWKYDNATKYSDILPDRVHGAKELYSFNKAKQ